MMRDSCLRTINLYTLLKSVVLQNRIRLGGKRAWSLLTPPALLLDFASACEITVGPLQLMRGWEDQTLHPIVVQDLTIFSHNDTARVIV